MILLNEINRFKTGQSRKSEQNSLKTKERCHIDTKCQGRLQLQKRDLLHRAKLSTEML